MIDELLPKMQSFIEKYKNVELNFNSLSEEDKYVYVAVETFCYFSNKLNYKETMKRVIDNCEKHKKDNYSYFNNKIICLKDTM